MNRRCLNCMHVFQVPEEYKNRNCVCPFCGFVENTPPTVATHLPPGVVINDRYEIGTVLGAGGFGITYRTWDRVLNNIVCVKEYFPKGVATRTETVTVSALTAQEAASFERGKIRFLNEARNLARFNSLAGTVSIYDFFEANGTAYIVMEYLEGCNMKDYTKANGSIVPFDMLRELSISICDILADIHKAGLIHRDISPDNIFLCKNGSVKLIDFGAAKQEVDDTGASSTIILKHGYAPIEQYSKSGRIGPWTDIYSVGATLYKLATGVTVPEAVERVTSDSLVPPEQINPMLPRNFCRALVRALAVQAENRFQNVTEFRYALMNGTDSMGNMVNQPVYPSGMLSRGMQNGGMPNNHMNGPMTSRINNQYDNQVSLIYRNNNTGNNSGNKTNNKRNIIIACTAGAVALIATIALIVVFSVSDTEEPGTRSTDPPTTEKAGVGGTDDSNGSMTAATTEATDQATTEALLPEDEGDVLVIHCWNDEFACRLKDHYPGYEANDPYDATAGGRIGDVEVKFVNTPSDDYGYQNNLDATLPQNDTLSDDDKVDIFLVEAEYALKYVNTDLCLPISDLGINVDTELSNQFEYTKDVVTDAEGTLKGVSWQGCPGVLIYNRQAAREVLGSDDPDTVQAAVKDWDTYNQTASDMKSHGYMMTATANDSYRVFSNNMSTPWVVDGKINIDDNLKKWADMTKEQVSAGCTGTGDLWSDDWFNGFYPEGKVFCYFGPAWMINYCMQADDPESIAGQGGWGATVGPQGFYWGGTWICVANGTDNPSLVADIIRKLTADESVMTEILRQDNDFVNNKIVMEEAAVDDAYSFTVLGGQNPLSEFCRSADSIDLSNITAYDQGCNESFQEAMRDYFNGNVSYDQALQNFYSSVTQKYPELSY